MYIGVKRGAGTFFFLEKNFRVNGWMDGWVIRSTLQSERSRINVLMLFSSVH